MNRRTTWLVAALLAVPALAQAQGIKTEDYNQRYDVQLQGGIGGFTGGAQSNTVDVGPAYGVMAAYNATPWLSGEVGYTGNTNAIVGTDSRLTANRVHAQAKVGPQLTMPVPWRPYAFAGLAANFIVAGGSRATTGYEDAVEGEIPLGVGADFFLNSPVRLGARGTFDYNPGVGAGAGPASEHPSAWQTSLTASATF